MNITDTLSILKTLQQGKELPRQGMILAGLKLSETDTVAAHSYTVTVYAYVLAKHFSKNYSFINPLETMEIALFHDIAELLTGDIGRNVKSGSKEIFDEIEIQAAKLFDEKANGELGLGKLVNSYNEKKSPNAWIVKTADLLDALVYYHSGYWQLKFSESSFSSSEKKFIINLEKQIENKSADKSVTDFYIELKSFFSNAVELIKSNKIKRIKFK